VDDPRIAETVNYVAIRRLQNTYADVVTRRAWSELPELFVPGARITIDLRSAPPMHVDGPEALGEFIADAIAGFDFFEFVILNTVIELGIGGDPDTAAGRMYMSELRQDRESGRRTTTFGLYNDRYRCDGGKWCFERRLYHSLARPSPDTLAYDLPVLRLDDL
jgi:hypothetical protein